jgi:hypothetical protein
VILADTSIWLDHLRRGDATLARLLTGSEVLGHPAIRGEIGMGSLANRTEVLALLGQLPQVVPASDQEAVSFVDTNHLFGIGLGLIDAHLLAAVALTPTAQLWTRDKRLRAAAERLGTHAALR